MAASSFGNESPRSRSATAITSVARRLARRGELGVPLEVLIDGGQRLCDGTQHVAKPLRLGLLGQQHRFLEQHVIAIEDRVGSDEEGERTREVRREDLTELLSRENDLVASELRDHFLVQAVLLCCVPPVVALAGLRNLRLPNHVLSECHAA